MLRSLVYSLVSAILITCLAASDVARGDEEQLSAVAQLIQAADAKTKTAESVEDYTAILGICEEAGQHELSEVQRDYFNQLTAWASNRRGEQYAAQAAEAATEGDDQQAAELDQLALADFETAVEFNPQRWKAIHNRGVSYALAGRYEDAIRDFSRVIELEPNYPNVWFNRGQIHYELGEFQEAVDDYNRMLQLSPQDAGAITNRAHARFELGQYREALQDYSRAVQLNPNSAQTLADRGDAYRALGDHPRAALDYRRAMQLADADSRVYQSAAWFMATSPQAQYRNAESALETARRALELAGDDDDYRYLDTLAAAYANSGQFDEAVHTIERAMERAPEPSKAALEARRELYAQQQPYREPASRSRAAARPGAR